MTDPPSYPPAASPPQWPQPYGSGPAYPAPYWGPPPGPWGAPPPPPRRKWTKRAVALVTGGAVLVAALVALVVVAGLNVGRDQVAPSLAGVGGIGGAVGTTAPPSDPTGLGTDTDLDVLAQDCHDGSLQACDELFDQSPSGSGYEQYGMTCGGRVKAYDVAACMDLEGLATTAPSAPPVGDDPGLDGYAQRCHDGLLSACDDLYSLSPPMSEYERYGMTCGGRVTYLTVATCDDLGGD